MGGALRAGELARSRLGLGRVKRRRLGPELRRAAIPALSYRAVMHSGGAPSTSNAWRRGFERRG